MSKYNSKKYFLYGSGDFTPLSDLQEEANYKEMNTKERKNWMDNLKKRGKVFDSKTEMERYLFLLELEFEGLISNLRCQPRYVLQPSCKNPKISVITYVADFEYIKDGVTIVEDVKGMPTQVAKLKKKLFMYNHRDKKLIWIVWATKKLGWMEYELNEQRKKKNRKKKNASK